MRFAFFALLFVNLAYFAWAQWIDAPRPGPVNEAVSHLPRLKLVEEVPPAERPQPHTAQKTALTPATACLSVGPFADSGLSAQAAALLEARGFETRQRAEQTQAAQSYWVYVGDLSESEADAALAALERGGIHDARLARDNGGAGRRLSLGVYSERARAERRAEAVRQSGLRAEISARRVRSTLYWVDLPTASEGNPVSVQGLQTRSASPIGMQPCPSGVVPGSAVPLHTAAMRPSTPAQELASARNPATTTGETPKLH